MALQVSMSRARLSSEHEEHSAGSNVKTLYENPIDLSAGTRIEKDLLGEREVPINAYYGVQTLRGIESYRITGVRVCHFPRFIIAFAQVKKACALANFKLGLLPKDKTEAIARACDELIDPESTAAGENRGVEMRSNFLVDMIQGGAGTSTNMNANEVIANRALEHLGKKKGEYTFCHPNDDVNKGQSTNDSYPTAAKIAMIHAHHDLRLALQKLADAFKQKGDEFAGIVKMGRTQLQDAVPMTLGQEFDAYGVHLMYDVDIIDTAMTRFAYTNLGGTAIGTGIAADPHFSEAVVKELQDVTELPIKLAECLIEASSSVSAMVFFSGILKRIALKVSKVCNDLRLLASGPRCGLAEINLPPMAPGSSIMPGKVNPVIPEVMNQCCFEVIGNDVAVSFGAEGGQLELNVMEPVIIYKLFTSVRVLTRGLNTFREKCVLGITANEERCKELVHHSIGIVTALLPHIGYKKCSTAAAKALAEKRPVSEIVVELGFLDEAQVKEYLTPENMCGPSAKKRRIETGDLVPGTSSHFHEPR